jgi:hypothetical protein
MAQLVQRPASGGRLETLRRPLVRQPCPARNRIEIGRGNATRARRSVRNAGRSLVPPTGGPTGEPRPSATRSRRPPRPYGGPSPWGCARPDHPRRGREPRSLALRSHRASATASLLPQSDVPPGQEFINLGTRQRPGWSSPGSSDTLILRRGEQPPSWTMDPRRSGAAWLGPVPATDPPDSELRRAQSPRRPT